jgi:hypothetical protein
VSAVNADSYDENGEVIRQVYTSRTREGRQQRRQCRGRRPRKRRHCRCAHLWRCGGGEGAAVRAGHGALLCRGGALLCQLNE